MRVIHFALTAVTFAVLTATSGAQSLWDARLRATPLAADTSARQVGDILTIVIDESHKVDNKEKSKLENESSLDAVLENFDVFPNMFEPLPQAKGSQSRTFDGKGEYSKDNRFQSRIAVVVIDVLPRGNLLVEGTRRLIMDGETKTVRITGLVRAYDVTRANTVRSDQVANASIAYEGTGMLTRATNKGWFSRLLDLVWPF